MNQQEKLLSAQKARKIEAQGVAPPHKQAREFGFAAAQPMTDEAVHLPKQAKRKEGRGGGGNGEKSVV